LYFTTTKSHKRYGLRKFFFTNRVVIVDDDSVSSLIMWNISVVCLIMLCTTCWIYWRI